MTNLCLLWALFSIKHKFYTIFIVIFSIIAACLEALGIGLIFPVIKILTTSKEEIEDIYRFLPMFISNNVNPTTMIFYLCALFLFKNVLLSIFTFIFNRYAALIRNDLSVRLYKQYIFAD
jgi:ABC-type multidrug transport system fused ATPase/permease subunit